MGKCKGFFVWFVLHSLQRKNIFPCSLENVIYSKVKGKIPDFPWKQMQVFYIIFIYFNYFISFTSCFFCASRDKLCQSRWNNQQNQKPQRYSILFSRRNHHLFDWENHPSEKQLWTHSTTIQTLSSILQGFKTYQNIKAIKIY